MKRPIKYLIRKDSATYDAIIQMLSLVNKEFDFSKLRSLRFTKKGVLVTQVEDFDETNQIY